MHLDPWTLALQTVNVLVLLWLLAHFLFRPVAAIIAQRRAAADALLSEAAATRAKAAEESTMLARQRDGLATEADRIRAEAHTAAEADHAAMLRQATDAATRLQSDAAKAISHDREAMREALEHEAGELAVAIARRLLQRLPPRALSGSFIDALTTALASYPARHLLAGEKLELRSAIPLDGAAQAECRAAISRVLGTEAQLGFTVDPDLIAGIELTGPHAEIRLSWRADLDRITHLLFANHSHDTEAQRVA